uniref:Uncharacterized protein n=1 Tax=Anguilla anguilla TaxID=7936 RepID=A0A0E9UKA9_ANGAN
MVLHMGAQPQASCRLPNKGVTWTKDHTGIFLQP